jgi:hypothetical protein
MLEQEEAFYQSHKAELIKKYAGKRLVIYKDQVIGAYDTANEAFLDGQKVLQHDDFMIKRVPRSLDAKPPRLTPFVKLASHG